MVSFDIGGAWGMHWFVHKWGEAANFILHFSIPSHSKNVIGSLFSMLGQN